MTDQKHQLRQDLRTKRKALTPSSHARASQLAVLRLLGQLDLVAETTIAVFWPIGSEIDTRPLIRALDALGVRILLPRTQARATPLTFHAWTPQLKLEVSAFGVQEPPASSSELDPTTMIIPLLGFDRAGYRLGYGAGHYDCTLAAMAASGLKPMTIGLAFDLQRVDELPREPHDFQLDLIITEAATYRPSA